MKTISVLMLILLVCYSYAQQNWLAQIDGVIGDFHRNYNDMRDANTRGADKYLHARANQQAAERGEWGRATAWALSIGREIFPSRGSFSSKSDNAELSGWWKDKKAAWEDKMADMDANKYGRNGGDLGKLVVKGLPKIYWPPGYVPPP